jgi:hypothetical protein
MTYVFDSNSFIVLGHYFPTRFPSFWERFDACVSDGRILSVKEVLRELDNKNTRPHLLDWVAANRRIFLTPSSQETDFVREIFSNCQYQTMIKQEKVLTGGPAADPFVIALAKIRVACVVTEETKKDGAVRIPTVCECYGIDCTNLEGFMIREGWVF